MTSKLNKISALILYCVFVPVYAYFFNYGELLIKPYSALTARMQLYSYPNYIALVVTPILITACVAIQFILLLKPDWELSKGYKKSWNITIVVTITVIIVTFGGRFYLGQRVDNAGYIKCVDESRTSSKSSWRVYAKDVSLCKDSSGIAGA